MIVGPVRDEIGFLDALAVVRKIAMNKKNLVHEHSGEDILDGKPGVIPPDEDDREWLPVADISPYLTITYMAAGASSPVRFVYEHRMKVRSSGRAIKSG